MPTNVEAPATNVIPGKTNGISIPDADKIQVPEGEEAVEETWNELTNNKGEEEDEDD